MNIRLDTEQDKSDSPRVGSARGLTVVRRLWMNYGFFALAILAVALAGFIVTANIEQSFEKVAEDAIVELDALGEIGQASELLLGETREYLLFGEEESLEEAAEAKADLTEALALYGGTEWTSEEEEEEEMGFFGGLEASILALEAQADVLIALRDEGDIEVLEREAEILEDIEGELQDILAAAKASSEEEVEETVLAVGQAVQNARLTLLAIPGLTLLLLLGSTAVFARVLARRLSHFTSVAQAITQGELDRQVTVDTQDEIGVLAGAFNSMTVQLRNLVSNLEGQVAARTQRLEMVASMGESLTAILDSDQLMNELVSQIQAQFGYYHTQVYVLNESGQNLVVVAGTGEAGRQMIIEQRTIALDAPASLVARAARTGEIVVVENVRQTSDWLPNPLLPDTVSEMAVPIIIEGRVVGVLDVQDDTVAGLDQSDAGLMRLLANYVTVSLNNAQLFARVEASLAEARELQAQYVQQAWQSTSQTTPTSAYERQDAPQLSEVIKQQLQQVAKVKDKPEVVSVDQEADQLQTEQPFTAIVAPIKLQNQVIGTMEFHSTDIAQQRAWTEEELALVQAIADQVAQSAENLRLFDQVQERASRERLIGQITDKLRRAPNMEALLETGVSELARVLGTGRTYVRFGSTDELQKATLQSGSSEAQPANSDDKPDPDRNGQD